MTLTPDEAKDALETAINGMLAELESGQVVSDQHGAMFQFVTRIPRAEGNVFGLAYLFVSEDEPRMIALHQAISNLFVER